MTTNDFEGYVPVPGGRLWAQAAGEGTGVVLVHAGIADARMWDPQWDALAARHRVVRYDTRGYGRTEGADVEFSNRADLVAVMDATGVDRATIVGCSRGGSIAVDTALEFPGRVAGLASVCGGLGGIDAEETPEETAAGERMEALWAAKDWEALADLEVSVWVDGVGQPAGRAPAQVREMVRRMILDTYVQEKPDGRSIALDPPAAGRLGEIRVPVQVIVGELDTLGTRQAAGLIAEAWPGRGGSTCRAWRTCPASSARSGSRRCCSGSWPRSPAASIRAVHVTSCAGRTKSGSGRGSRARDARCRAHPSLSPTGSGRTRARHARTGRPRPRSVRAVHRLTGLGPGRAQPRWVCDCPTSPAHHGVSG